MLVNNFLILLVFTLNALLLYIISMGHPLIQDFSNFLMPKCDDPIARDSLSKF